MFYHFSVLTNLKKLVVEMPYKIPYMVEKMYKKNKIKKVEKFLKNNVDNVKMK